MQAVVLFYKLGGDFPGPNLDTRDESAHASRHTQEIQLADFVQNGLTDPRVAAQVYAVRSSDAQLRASRSNFPVALRVGTGGTRGRVSDRARPALRVSSATTSSSSGIAQGLGGAPATHGGLGRPGRARRDLRQQSTLDQSELRDLAARLPLDGHGRRGRRRLRFARDRHRRTTRRSASATAYLQAAVRDRSGQGVWRSPAGLPDHAHRSRTAESRIRRMPANQLR